MSNIPLLQINDLVVEYPGPVYALKGLNLTLEQGEVMCVLGRNGAGKTTLLKALCGLLLPKQGQIYWNTPQGQRPKLGVLLEGSRAFYWNLTGWENAIYFAALNGLPEHELDTQLSALFHLVGLWEARHRLAGDYSSGMKKRLSLLIALFASPKLLILDEPTAGLDRETVLEFEEYLRRIASGKQVTILCATHELSFAFTVATRIVYLEDGQLQDWNWAKILGRHRQAIFLLAGETSNTSVSADNGYLRFLGDGRWQLEGPTEDPRLFSTLSDLITKQGLHILQIHGVD